MRAQVSAALASKRSQSTINVLIACCCAGDVQRPFMRGAFAPEGARGARTQLDQHYPDCTYSWLLSSTMPTTFGRAVLVNLLVIAFLMVPTIVIFGALLAMRPG